MDRNSSILPKFSPNDRSCFVYVNNEAHTIMRQTSNNPSVFAYDISNLSIDFNKPYRLYIKSVNYSNSINQLCTANYNYNQMYVNFSFVGTGAPSTTINYRVAVREGIYNATQLASELTTSINSLISTIYASIGISNDKYTVSYDSISGKFTIYRQTATKVTSTNYYSTLNLLSNTSYDSYNSMFGFGLSWIIGLNSNTSLNIDTVQSNVPQIGVTNQYYLTNPCNLMPFTYFYVSIDGISNKIISSDFGNSNTSIVVRLPLIQAPWSDAFYEENNPEYSQLYFGVLPRILRFTLLDQYANVLQNLSSNFNIDLQIKLVPVE